MYVRTRGTPCAPCWRSETGFDGTHAWIVSESWPRTVSTEPADESDKAPFNHGPGDRDREMRRRQSRHVPFIPSSTNRAGILDGSDAADRCTRKKGLGSTRGPGRQPHRGGDAQDIPLSPLKSENNY